MFSVEEIRIATSLTPNTPNSCHCILKKDIYTLSDHEQTEPRILLIKAFPLNAALFRRQAKITLIELSLNQDRLVLHYEILDGDMDCEVKLECEQVRRPWMEHPRSIDP